MRLGFNTTVLFQYGIRQAIFVRKLSLFLSVSVSRLPLLALWLATMFGREGSSTTLYFGLETPA